MGASGSKEGASAVPEACATAQAAGRGDCPAVGGAAGAGPYNVYNTPLGNAAARDTLSGLNQMPLEPNQAPAPGQRAPLSTDRVSSTIPKGGTSGETWTYPSPQMFFNALRRKGKGDDVTEADMEAVVRQHNTMNELTWQAVLQWENLHAHAALRAADSGAPPSPMLLRFRGRPDELSPLARVRWLAGGPLPFDRHDWWVLRDDREVRYVIDFYFDDDKAGRPDAFSVVARPALDTPEAALDRTKMFIYQQCAEWGLPCPITGASVGSAPVETPSPSRGFAAQQGAR